MLMSVRNIFRFLQTLGRFRPRYVGISVTLGVGNKVSLVQINFAEEMFILNCVGVLNDGEMRFRKVG